MTWLVGRGSAVRCGRRGLLLPSVLSFCWFMNSLSSQHPPQTGVQLRSGNYTYLWLSEMPVLIIIKKIPSQYQKTGDSERQMHFFFFPLTHSKR